MAKRVGHCSDMEVAKWEIEQKFKNSRNWQHTQEFMTQKEAQDWVTKASEEYKCKTVTLKTKKKAQRMRWFGFVFALPILILHTAIPTVYRGHFNDDYLGIAAGLAGLTLVGWLLGRGLHLAIRHWRYQSKTA